MTVPSFDLSGKRALVVGGRTGIGLTIARAFKGYGAEVMVTGTQHDHDAVQSLKAEDIAYFALDVRDDGAVQMLAANITNLDILVNCAGLVIRDEKGYETAAFQDTLDVNLTGTMRLCNAFRPHLEKSRGAILNIASLTTFIGSPKTIGYGAAKAGIAQLTQSLAIAWAPLGIRVNAIAPGYIRTKINQEMQDKPEFDSYVSQRTPLGRWGAPEEIAGGAVYLCSDAATYVTGTTLAIDGGFLAT
ncbi:MAG: hypothetical protein CMM50_02060 [Rhodospirillaceae bacterium]|nr:hypothetical protein [Rhodospirillaceae bacterium]